MMNRLFTALAVAMLSFAALLPAPALAQAGNPDAVDLPPFFAETFLNFPEDAASAKKGGKRLLLYFGQDGCPYCKTLLETNFTQKAIVDKTKAKFVAIGLNLWGDRETVWFDGVTRKEKDLAKHLKVQFTPTILLLDEKGATIARINGYYPPHRFSAALDYSAQRLEGKTGFAEHMQTVRKLTQHGIPVEMNDPNHWCSRWASDAVVVADYALIASVMRACGVQDMVLQMQFNKPKEMSDRGDLAKFMAAKEIAGAMLEPSTRLWLETRTGIEWLEPDLTLARQQLARSTLLQMFMNPHAIHIVSYCEALYAAKPADIALASGVIRKAVRMFHRHETDLLKLLESDELQQRKHYLLDEAKYLLRQIASLNPAYHAKPNPPDIPPFNALADPDVLHQALVQGVMGAPGIFTEPYRQIANRMATDVMDGGVINPIDPVSLAPVNEAQRIALLHREPAA